MKHRTQNTIIKVFLILLLLNSTFFLYNCSKESISSSEQIQAENILNILADPIDLENDKVTEIQYHFASTFNMLLDEDPSIKPYLIESIEESNENQIVIIDFLRKLERLERFDNLLKESLKTRRNFQNEDFEESTTEKLASFMIHEDLLYFPVLTFLQDDIRSLDSKVFAIGIGEEIDSDENIISFLPEKMLLLNEESVKDFDGILLVVNNHIEFEHLTNQKENIASSAIPNFHERSDNTSIRLSAFKVKNGYRYESNGDTDYRIKIYRGSDIDSKTYSVSKSEVESSTLFAPDDEILSTVTSFAPCDPSLLPNGCGSLFETAILTYEYDWNQSSKAFDVYADNVCSLSNPVVNVEGRRKYWNETYDYRVNGDSCWFENDLDLETQLSSTKSTHTVKRVDL